MRRMDGGSRERLFVVVIFVVVRLVFFLWNGRSEDLSGRTSLLCLMVDIAGASGSGRSDTSTTTCGGTNTSSYNSFTKSAAAGKQT